MVLHVGAKVEPMEAPSQDGRTHKLDFQGVTVLYFYPKDDTPGCTKEACSFRDSLPEFIDRGVRVFGVSTDSVESHQTFALKYSLNFPLLVDKDRAICKAFDVPAVPSAKRVTYIIADGIVVYADPAVRAEGHGADILKKIDELT
ncbi:MAG: peroxiredoxin [Candidatus Aenigmatarchaeota archaeon]|nr:MAG: peroxiredoxin [Candidatus Aenigmarchaeota archaeon]